MTPTKPSELTSHLSYWIRYISVHVTHGLGARFAEEGVSVAEWNVLRELYGLEATAPGRIADGLGITHGAMSKLADRLLEKKLVSKLNHQSDGRTHSLVLTDDGKALVPRLAALADQFDIEFFATFSADDRKTMDRLMRDLVKHRALRPVSGRPM